jgi:predicted nucleic acid-binding protein
VSEALVYLDSSAIIKLLFDEPETPALSEFLVKWPNRVSSTLARVEVLRASRLVGDAVVTRHAREILTGVHLVRADEGILAAAAMLEPPTLRTLDSIHLATALSLGRDLAGMVVYDRRLREGARSAGLRVWAPR